MSSTNGKNSSFLDQTRTQQLEDPFLDGRTDKTDGQTDGQTDRPADLIDLIKAMQFCELVHLYISFFYPQLDVDSGTLL